MIAIAGSRGGGGWPDGGATGGVASASTKSRPSAIRAPSTANRFGVVAATRICSGSAASPPIGVRPAGVMPAKASNDVVCCRRSRKSGGENGQSGTLRARSSPHTRTSRGASTYGSGRSSTVLTTLKIAEQAAMPRPIVRIATAMKPGLLRSVLAA